MVQLTAIFSVAFLANLITSVSALVGTKGIDTSSYNRPLIHFTPNEGWMNDPNGLWYDKTDKVWHMYFQYNPNATVWGPPYWGHATSKDLVTWDEKNIALAPEGNGDGIFSGSAVIDSDNTSGFFDHSIPPDKRVVAIYTNNLPDVQTQDVAYSLDGGSSFIKYKHNPIIDVNSTQFRDPKVFWHAKTSQWIMVVLLSQEYKVQIYGSSNLKQWQLHSNFTSGYLPFQFECPGLIEVPVENSTETKWVMNLSTNPGSPLGGSFNQYFIGDFDGFEFIADDSFSRLMDTGKDFYAFQTFSDTVDGVYGVAWASNWQYSGLVPTNPWRSSMTLPRKYTLRYVDTNPETEMLTLVQNPIIEDSSFKHIKTLKKKNYSITNKNPLITNFEDTKSLFDFNVTFTVLNPSAPNATNFEILINSNTVNGTTDSIRVGFDNSAASFYINRNIPDSEFQKNPFFNEKLTEYIQPLYYNDDNLPVYNFYGVIDRNIIELFFNNGEAAMTNTFFMSEGKYPSQIEISSDTEEALYEFESVKIRQLILE